MSGRSALRAESLVNGHGKHTEVILEDRAYTDTVTQVRQSRRKQDGVVGYSALDALLIAVLTFALAVLGLAMRVPHGLAAFWPANAVLLGVLILRPRMARPFPLGVALAVFVAADLTVAGTPLLPAVLFNAINVVGIVSGYLAFRRIFGARIDFGQPFSMLQLCLVALVVAAVEGVLGGLVSPFTSGPGMVAGALEWFSEELLSCMTLLPVVLSAPAFLRRTRPRWRRRFNFRRMVQACLPTVALAVSLAMSLLVGGGGAIAFPVIALSYCALRYGVFITSLLVVFFTIWTTQMAVSGVVPVLVGPADLHGLMSLRLAIASIALAPLIISSVMTAEARMLARWRSMADSDSLTGVFNSRGFYREARMLLRTLKAGRQSVAALMVDLDFFKQVNDTYGHGAGDGALIVAAGLLRQGLREGDVCGRLGGEEFGVLLSDSTLQEAQAIAERIRASLEACQIPIEGRAPIRLTASFGVSFADPAPSELPPLMHAADRALYQAKRDGRNRVCVWKLPLP